LRNSTIQDRQRELSDQLMARQQPFNEYSAFMSGAQVGSPDFEGYNTAGMAPAADMYGAAQDTYGAQMDAYNAKMAAKANKTGGLLGLAGTIGGSFFGPIGASIGGAIGKRIGG
jgi:hypothetical protein